MRPFKHESQGSWRELPTHGNAKHFGCGLIQAEKRAKTISWGLRRANVKAGNGTSWIYGKLHFDLAGDLVEPCQSPVHL
jgi:hypothetical protein